MVLVVIGTGITRLGIGQSIYDWVTGHAVSQKIDTLSAQIQDFIELGNRLYYVPRQEVWDIDRDHQRIIDDRGQIRAGAFPIQQALKMNLVVSQPIVTPSRLKAVFTGNPEDILSQIPPLRWEGLPPEYVGLSDPTVIPVIFSRWNQDFIGLMKIGYAKEFLGFEYRPQSSLYVPVTSTQLGPTPPRVSYSDSSSSPPNTAR
jgi:hypothetical protein